MWRIATVKSMFTHKGVRQKVLFTLLLVAIYRFLVFIPVPFADISIIVDASSQVNDGLSQFLMLLWWSVERFSILSVWLAPFINASIIMQLLTIVIPKLEELQELGEQWTQQIQQYTRYLTFPLSFLQWLWMVYIINSLWNISGALDTSNFTIVLMSAFALSVWAMILIWIGDLISEKWISSGISLLIYASIVAWMTSQINSTLLSAVDTSSFFWMLLFILVIVWILTLWSVWLLKSVKNIPVVYARQGKVEQTSSLPIPLNPVGMIPIIFSVAFVTFPYLISEFLLKLWSPSEFVQKVWNWIMNNFNYFVQDPSWLVIMANFVLIVLFTFFYTMIVFNPDKIADNIQKKWGFIPGIRPWDETVAYIYKTLQHLSLWWGIWLWVLGIFDKLLYKIPLVTDLSASLWTIPIVVTWSWIIIIVWVVQEITSKVETELLMAKYDSM